MNSGSFADFGEARVFAQEPVARMDRVGVGDFGGADDRGNVQVAAGALGRPDADGLIGEAHVRAVAIGLGVDRYGLNPHSLQALMMRTAISPRLAMRIFLNRPDGK